MLSRKRKLRELLSVASTDDDEIPNHDFDNTDAPSASTTETKLLHSSEALQYVRFLLRSEDDGSTRTIALTKAPSTKAQNMRRKSIPTVVFGKQPKHSSHLDDHVMLYGKQKPGQISLDDYFSPLFIEGFTKQTQWMKPLEKLLNTAHKTVSTPDQFLSLQDHQACKILRRVYHLQQHNKWSLRQPMRCPEPVRRPGHWDLLLREMKWMRTDFREERKWKMAVARNLAHACAEWVWATPEQQATLQVNITVPPLATSPDGDRLIAALAQSADERVPDLVHSDSPTNQDDNISTPLATEAPSAIFGLQDDEVIFGLQRSQASDQLLEELPLYGVPLSVPKADLAGPDFDPDAHWKRRALPLSKYVEGEMILATGRPPKRPSRYQYAAEDEDENEGRVVFGVAQSPRLTLPVINTQVALFNPETKPIRDRLHAGHQFRPPTDQYMPMPPQSFYESRSPSLWTFAEDDELRSLVRDYSYNWFLISSVMATKTMFPSGADRRTPWECFERWVALEGFPNDMSKAPYFRMYQNRIDTAQRLIQQQNQAATQHVGPNGAVTPVPRRRSTLPLRVERRRSQKHLAMIDAFRKLAKKRETAASKAKQAADQAVNRKTNEAPRPQVPTKTPRDYSLMRWERDQQLADRMAQYAQRQQEALQKRVSLHHFQWHPISALMLIM